MRWSAFAYAAVLSLATPLVVWAASYTPTEVNQIYFEDAGSTGTITIAAANSTKRHVLLGVEFMAPTTLTAPAQIHCGGSFATTDRLGSFNFADNSGYTQIYAPLGKWCAVNKALTLTKASGDTVRGFAWWVTVNP